MMSPVLVEINQRASTEICKTLYLCGVCLTFSVVQVGKRAGLYEPNRIFI